MSVLFETLERLETKTDGGSTGFDAEAWSRIQDSVDEMYPTSKPSLRPRDIPRRARPAPTFDFPLFWANLRGAAVDLGTRSRKPLLALAISALAVLTLYVSLPMIGATALRLNHAVNQSLAQAHQPALDEDFRAGLGNWTPAPSWSVDAAGFAHPGKLALYRPSIGLADYQMQFLGTIDKKSLAWVVRAADSDNYYAVKLTLMKPGAFRTITVARYAVINGQIQNRVTIPISMQARPDTLYRVRVDVHGANFALKVQDQLVDTWSEPRLQHGGVGFFSEENAKSGVTGVQVKAQR